MLANIESRLKISIFMVGFTTMVSQVVLLRNFLSVFSGMELIIGIILSNWMLLTALGAYLGRFFKIQALNLRLVFLAHIALGILPLAMNFVIVILKNEIGPPGIAMSLLQIYLSSFFLLLPFCIISGFLFTGFSSVYSSYKKENKISSIYGIEALGSIAGGLTFNFFLIFVFESFFILKLILIINFLVALVFYFIGNEKKSSWIMGIGAIITAGVITMLDIGQVAYEKYFRSQEIIARTETLYGNIAVTKSDDQINFYENGVLFFSSDNVITNEENVHYAMLQHPDPEKVLIISGGVSGTVAEVLKHGTDSIDYMELDQGIIELAKKHLPSARFDRQVRVLYQDPRLFIKTSKNRYDVILMNLPDPDNSQINRLFTLEFFEEAKDRLNENGVISTSLSGFANYMSPESRDIHTALYSTMKLVFDDVMIIPGQRNYFIASDGPLSPSISSLSKRKNLNTKYVNHYYLDDQLILLRKRQIEEAIEQSLIINYDLEPSVYLFQMKVWLSKFKIGTGIVATGLLILCFLIVRINAVNHGLFITGFSATSLEMILLLAFQVIYGYVYFIVGIYISLFMAGLMVGSLFIVKHMKTTYRNFSGIQYLMGITAILIPFTIFQIRDINSNFTISHLVFGLFIILIGLMTGVQFALGSRLRSEDIARIASGSYGADSLGSSIGALLTVVYLVPTLGLVKVCLIVGILNFITGLYILLRMKRRGGIL